MISMQDHSSPMPTANLIVTLDQIEIYSSMLLCLLSKQASNMKQKYSYPESNAEMHPLTLVLKILTTTFRLRLFKYEQPPMLSHSLSIFKSVMSSTEQLLNSVLPLFQSPPLNSLTILCPIQIASPNQNLNSML